MNSAIRNLELTMAQPVRRWRNSELAITQGLLRRGLLWRALLSLSALCASAASSVPSQAAFTVVCQGGRAKAICEARKKPIADALIRHGAGAILARGGAGDAAPAPWTFVLLDPDGWSKLAAKNPGARRTRTEYTRLDARTTWLNEDALRDPRERERVLTHVLGHIACATPLAGASPSVTEECAEAEARVLREAVKQ